MVTLPYLQLEVLRSGYADAGYSPSAADTIRLDEWMRTDKGVQAVAGLTGLGLPPVSLTTSDSQEGVRRRNKRVQPRAIDLPLNITASSRDELRATLSKLALITQDQCVLRLCEGSEGVGGIALPSEYWYVVVDRAGGGGYSYGVDTRGDTEVNLVITLQAHRPYWERGGDKALLESTAATQTWTVASGGDAPAKPVWTLQGPATAFSATCSQTGATFSWSGSIAAGESRIFDTDAGTVVGGGGTNRYAELGPAPRLWPLPPGNSSATTVVLGSGSGTKVSLAWRPRRNMVI